MRISRRKTAHFLGKIRLPALGLAAALIATACGGGGGGSASPPAPVNTAPTVNAGGDQTVARNVAVALDGSATDNGGPAGLSYTWSQSAGTTVTLAGADTPNASFTSPDVGADEVLTFTLDVSDNAGLSGSDTVSVTVLRNIAPTVSAGADLAVEQNDTVSLTAVASDDDDIAGLTYAWVQTSGPSVPITGADTATATFIAPATSGSQTLTFSVTVTDAFGESATDSLDVDVFEDLSATSVTGKAQYEFVPFDGTGLDFGQTALRPIRGATIQLIDSANGTVLAEGITDDAGDYLLTTQPNTTVFLRIRAELKRSGPPGWDVEVRDNTSSTTLPLGQRPLYALDGAPFTTGVGAQTVNIQALSGWTGSGYTNARAAAPFAILDTIYTAMQLVLTADADAVFAPLDAFWSVNNSPTITNNRDFDTGELGTSFYRGDLDSLFLLGQADADTEEFDTHVVAHEWGHYFEDNFSRSDSIGGSHSLSQRLDPRLAFGEGFGNAVAAMIVGSTIYFDTQGAQQSGGFSFNLESNSPGSSTRGWYNERSIQAVLFDLFDDNTELGDGVELGFGPIYDVLVNEQADGVPFTTIFPFIEALKARNPGSVAAIDALLSPQRISTTADAYGTGETEDAGRPNDVLPLYTDIAIGGPAVNICSTNAFDPNEDGNKLSIRRFVRFNVATPGDYTVDIITTTIPATGQSDPDAAVFSGGFITAGFSGVADRETFVISAAQAGDYVMEVYEFSYLSGSTPAISQPDSRTCFDITIAP